VWRILYIFLSQSNFWTSRGGKTTEKTSLSVSMQHRNTVSAITSYSTWYIPRNTSVQKRFFQPITWLKTNYTINTTLTGNSKKTNLTKKWYLSSYDVWPPHLLYISPLPNSSRQDDHLFFKFSAQNYFKSCTWWLPKINCVKQNSHGYLDTSAAIKICKFKCKIAKLKCSK